MMTSAFPLLCVIAAIVALGVTGSLFSPSPFVIATQAGAIGLSIWARRSFAKGAFRVTAGPAGPLMSGGPYRFLRHPMYSAALLFIWAAVLSHLAAWTAAIGAAVTIVVAARVVAEERLLRARYPEYREYARSTKALIPFIL